MSLPSYRRKFGGYWHDIQYQSKELSIDHKHVDEHEEIREILKDAARALKARQFAETISGADLRP